MNAQSTAYLFTFLGMMLNASALGVSWHLARPMPGGGAWFAGASLVFLGFVPLIINLTTPWLPLVSMHNLAVAVGQAIVVGGIFTYFGKPPPWRVLVGLVCGFMLLHSWFLYVDYDVARRTVVASMSLALVNVIGAWQLSVAPFIHQIFKKQRTKIPAALPKFSDSAAVFLSFSVSSGSVSSVPSGASLGVSASVRRYLGVSAGSRKRKKHGPTKIRHRKRRFSVMYLINNDTF